MKEKQSAERKEKGEGKGRREGAGGWGKQGVGRGRQRAGRHRSRQRSGALPEPGRPERVRAELLARLSVEPPRNSAGSGFLLPRRGAGRGRGEERRFFGEGGLNPACTVCACFWEGHRREDGSNDLIFLFFPGTISAQIGRMK